MAKDDAYVIVGASLAGAHAAQTLRDEGFDGQVILIGDEKDLPYERPPLSKDYLMGKSGREKLLAEPADWYGEHDVELRLGETVTGIDRGSQDVILGSGSTVGYDKLLLTTGSSPRRLEVPGADADGVHYLRRISDSDRIKEVITESSRIAVIGAGWIGLEVAAAARTAGLDVSVVEMAELPLLNVLGPEVAQIFATLHADNGTDLVLGAHVSEITVSRNHADGIRLADGSHLRADAIIVGVGVTPNTGLAAGAGLTVDNGVLVDARLRTSDESVFAAGDVANAFHPFYGKHLRVEHWSNARHQPRAAARAMLGQDVSYDRVPYFFTDQYDLGMEYAGYVEPGGYDRVVFRGDTGAREFIAFWLAADNRVLAGMNVNIWDVNDTIMAIAGSGRPVDPAALADPSVPLESLAAG
ncbi:MAG TPA: FAD-dependent oxidoreductase [Streptosporangiaceae bacterium]|jgi:3-phenylpropionate/trans-cinnamate dioxygenase ferredoxin reductase subunit|nr:FAD-dependent oxidoreductase [Streptosporangiaceae bacterium]